MSKLGLSWEYEPEGFELPSGRYLPDFWLVELDLWVEVKGSLPSGKEIKLACELAQATGKWVAIFHTDFQREWEGLIAWAILCMGVDETGSDAVLSRCSWAICSECYRIGVTPNGSSDLLPCKHRGGPLSDLEHRTCPANHKPSLAFFQYPYRAAASARFEFGEEG
jgi:hypothetical protein